MQPRPVVFTRSFRLCKRGHYWLCNTPQYISSSLFIWFPVRVCQRAEKAFVETFWPTQLFLHALLILLTVCHWTHETRCHRCSIQECCLLICPDSPASVRTLTPLGHVFAVCLLVAAHVSSSLCFFKKTGFILAFLVWLLQWVIMFKSKPDWVQSGYYWWKIWPEETNYLYLT